MHFTEYWAIVEHDHAIQNPSSPEKLLLLADYCGVRDGMRVLDIGCGKGWLLRAWAERWAISGAGVEINPWFIAEARRLAQEQGVAGRLEFFEQPAADFAPAAAGYDLVLCIGASFALGGFDAALAWMRQALRPDGMVAIGEPFVAEAPLPAEALAALGFEANGYRDLAATVAALEVQGFELQGLIAAAPDDWDRYESPKWRAASRWAREHPEHQHREELLAGVAEARRRYLQWQRRYINWAIFVGRAA